MRNAFRFPLLLVLAAAVAAPAWAGIHYEATTTATGTVGDRVQEQRTVIEAWMDGGKLKILLRDADNPVFGRGSYMLSSDGGETLYLVNPEEKTYAEWGPQAMLQTMGATVEIENVEVTHLGQEAGPAMLGLPTTHTAHRIKYDMAIQVMGTSQVNHTELTQEFWTTPEIDVTGSGAWVRKALTTGFEELDKVLKADMGQVQGLPLKLVITSVITDEKGERTMTTTTTMEVTSLDASASIPDSIFALPEGYTRTEENPLAPGGPSGGGGR